MVTDVEAGTLTVLQKTGKHPVFFIRCNVSYWRLIDNCIEFKKFFSTFDFLRSFS